MEFAGYAERNREVKWGPNACAHQTDLMVLQFDNVMKDTDKCLSLSRSYQKGDNVHVVGFPSESSNRRGYGLPYEAVEKKLTFSSGSIVEQDHCKVELSSRGSYAKYLGKSLRFDEEQWDGATNNAYLHFRRMNRVVQTDLDSVRGMSGGPILDSQNNVIGVNSFFEGPYPNSVECKGRQFGFNINALETQALNSGFNLAELRCSEKKSAPPSSQSIQSARSLIERKDSR